MKVDEVEAAPSRAGTEVSSQPPSARERAAIERSLAAAPRTASLSAATSNFVGDASTVVASQVALAVVGLASLPLLTRQLGPAAYGEFSLFIALVGFVTYQDVARQLLIREETSGETSAAERAGVARASTLLVTALALGVGLAALPLGAAAALTIAAALHGLASRDFAVLNANGRVGFANSSRNIAWAGAFALCAAMTALDCPTWAFAWPFAAANLALALVYRRASPSRETRESQSGLSALRTSPHRKRLERAGLDLLGFSLASSAIAALDRVLLDELVGGEAFGVYCGAADIALRLHVVSSALAAALFPMLVRELSDHGYERAARRFVGVASIAAPLYFAVLALGIALAPGVLPWLLGDSFAASAPIFVALLVVLFIHSFGFLATPWQRAQGDFCSQRRAYTLAACLMVGVGLFAIPRWGAWGAVAAFAAARTAELQLVAIEALRLPRAVLPRWKLAAAALMFVTLAAFGAWRIGES